MSNLDILLMCSFAESLVPELQQSHGLTVHGAVEVVDNTPIQYRDLATKSTYPSKEETQTGVLAFLSGWQKNSKARSSDQVNLRTKPHS